MRFPLLPQSRFEWLALLVFLGEVVVLGYFTTTRPCLPPTFCPEPDTKISDLFLFLGIFFGIPAVVYGANWLIYKLYRSSKRQTSVLEQDKE